MKFAFFSETSVVAATRQVLSEGITSGFAPNCTMLAKFADHISKTLEEIKAQGLYKTERIITGPQNAEIPIADGRRVINLCANNYLGLADHPALIAAAKEALDSHGFGMASVRFICGTQDIHKELEAALTKFLGTEDTILYPSCFDANGGLFETLLGAEDAVISDELNHASIIDGVRLCKAQRFRYKNCDMADLEAQLQAAKDARFRLIATDGVFSMDGTIANLKGVCDLAEKYDALVMVDDAHAAGFIGKTGRGTPEHCEVQGRIDVITGTLGKALGGASGGYTSGRKEIVALLRQRSRPYLFSNTVAPPIVAASLKALELLTASTELRDKLEENTKYFRAALTERGLTIKPGTHPIVPIMLGDAALSQKFAARMLEKGVYVIGFFYPVVPHGTARVRTQVSAAHSRAELEQAVQAFTETNAELAG
jgi:glycine C-acetyltransferase